MRGADALECQLHAVLLWQPCADDVCDVQGPLGLFSVAYEDDIVDAQVVYLVAAALALIHCLYAGSGGSGIVEGVDAHHLCLGVRGQRQQVEIGRCQQADIGAEGVGRCLPAEGLRGVRQCEGIGQCALWRMQHYACHLVHEVGAYLS